MKLQRVLCPVLCFLPAAPARPAAVYAPERGFVQNVGQDESDVLYVHDQRIFYRDRVQLVPRLSIQFAGASPAAAPAGKDPMAWPLNVYLDSNWRRWRENVPHFASLRYSQIYPGIDADWHSGTGLPTLRFTVAPGADPQQLLLRVLADEELRLYVSSDSVIANSLGMYFSLSGLVAYQQRDASPSRLAVRFAQVDAATFRPAVDHFDSSLPLVIELGAAPFGYVTSSAPLPAYDDAVFLTGYASQAFVAKLTRNGAPFYLSLFGGSYTPSLVRGRDGELTLIGKLSVNAVAPPVTPDAPRPVPVPWLRDGWVARLDKEGRLRAATFTGGSSVYAVDPEGAVYFATPSSVVKWRPGSSQFDFTAPLPGVTALAAGAGVLAFAAPTLGGWPVTPGALKNHYEGPWDLYVGVLDTLSGRVRMASYVPIIGRTSEPFSSQSSLALAPDGAVWISSAFQYESPASGQAHTLVAVNAGGSKILYSESFPSLPMVSFDSQDNVFVALATEWQSLPTVAAAPLRAGCLPSLNLYLQTLAADGSLRDATYIPGTGQIVAFDGPERLFVTPSPYLASVPERIDTRPAVNPGIACVVQTASRQPRTELSPGVLYTLVGAGLGPLEQAFGTPAGGRLPAILDGVEVRINQVPMPLVSAQQGLITFYIPEGLPRGTANIEVRRDGVPVASRTLFVAASSDFGLFTEGSHGRGLLAALNQDGTRNTRDNPAKWGSAVSIFGAGPLAGAFPLALGILNVYYGGSWHPVIEFAGQAPGLAPGVQQINFRLPADKTLPRGWIRVYAGAAVYNQPPVAIFAAP